MIRMAVTDGFFDGSANVGRVAVADGAVLLEG